ncbi:hypothetical protein KY290_034286 [Solanum tuberosum]|uniref:Uncharacterized protein n=1 Tax=Solanum tuberosum TaxID=4113 RepID=A0ABQ7U4L2_SOLTU|nr:hypothetical protein KY290_034286 [Solanum tuberosum]
MARGRMRKASIKKPLMYFKQQEKNVNQKKQQFGITTISEAQLITPEDERNCLQSLQFGSFDPAQICPIAEGEEMDLGVKSLVKLKPNEGEENGIEMAVRRLQFSDADLWGDLY